MPLIYRSVDMYFLEVISATLKNMYNSKVWLRPSILCVLYTESLLSGIWAVLFDITFNYQRYEDVIKWNFFPRHWLFVRGIHQSPVNCPPKRPVVRSFDVFFDLRLNKRLSKQWCGWWFETPSHPLWRHSNVIFKRRKLFCIENKSGFTSEFQCAT